jgi:anti-sigma factor RsiW
MERQMTDSDPPIDTRIVALADGSLPADQREALQAEIEASAPLRAELAEQRRAVSLLRATDEIVAPASLRASVGELTSARPARRRPRFTAPRIFVPVATALAIAVVAVVVAVQASSAPSITQTAHLALAAATGPTPVVDPRNEDHLTAHVGAVSFPSYQTENGWRANGSRTDTLDGRAVTTVFYKSPNGMRVGYSIVSGKPLADPKSGRTITRDGVRYILSGARSSRLVTWWKDDHTCVIAGRGASDEQLLALATADMRS